MPDGRDLVHLMRLGTHAEQKYFIRQPDLPDWYDILVLNANIVDYFAKGTASLLAGPLFGRKYFIDPLTHSFGHNPVFLMSKGEIKKSIQSIADRFGSPVRDGINQARALTAADFSDGNVVKEFTLRVLEFQINRLSEALEDDAKYLEESVIPEPILLIPPYFYMDISNYNEWLPRNINFIKTAKAAMPEKDIFGELVVDRGVLEDPDLWQSIADTYIATEELDGLIIWISDFSEHEASSSQLLNLRLFIERLSTCGKPIYNLFGGYYSLLLHHFGLSGVCHGPGYGENRDVVPVGGGIPKPKYYLTPVHQRLLHSEVQLLIDQGAWPSIEAFQEEVCNGPFCKTILAGDLGNFYLYGRVEPRQRVDGSFYNVPLPETIEAMNFHYLEAKAIEFSNVTSLAIEVLIEQLRDAYEKYRKLMPPSELRYLVFWANVLSM